LTDRLGNPLAESYVQTFEIAPLDALTNDESKYELTVIGAGIEDFGGNRATNSLATAWARSDRRSAVVSVGPVAPDPRHTVVATVGRLSTRPGAYSASRDVPLGATRPVSLPAAKVGCGDIVGPQSPRGRAS
jgi:hypothetical protein